MSTEPLRTLVCIGNNQNFFDLPKDEIGPVWVGISTMLSTLKNMDGVSIIGTFDDDSHMVGPSEWAASSPSETTSRAEDTT